MHTIQTLSMYTLLQNSVNIKRTSYYKNHSCNCYKRYLGTLWPSVHSRFTGYQRKLLCPSGPALALFLLRHSRGSACKITLIMARILRVVSLSLTYPIDAADCITMRIGDGQADRWCR